MFALVHVACFIIWTLAVVHRGRRGPMIAGHTIRVSARVMGLLIASFTGVWILHGDPALLSDMIGRGQILVFALLLGLDHLTFHRAASVLRARSTLVLACAYLILSTLHS